MTSGTAAVAYCIYLGKRRGYGTEKLAYRPNSVQNVVLGTVLLWFGWFGFNGGSALASDFRGTFSISIFIFVFIFVFIVVFLSY